MNKRDSMKFLVPAALLASALAGAEEWHPSGFQPVPVFEDEGLAGRAPPPRTSPAKPTAAAVPKDSPPAPVAEKSSSPPQPPAAKTARAAAAAEETVAPGAGKGHPSGFEPPPVFEDEGLARRSAPPRTPPSAAKAAEPVAAPAPKVNPPPAVERPATVTALSAPPPAAAGVQSSGAWTDLLAANYPVGLIVLALAGYVFWNARRTGGGTPRSRNDPAGAPEQPATAGETGVARYLAGLGQVASKARSATGVAKYLEGLDSGTGVAKYLKRQEPNP